MVQNVFFVLVWYISFSWEHTRQDIATWILKLQRGQECAWPCFSLFVGGEMCNKTNNTQLSGIVMQPHSNQIMAFKSSFLQQMPCLNKTGQHQAPKIFQRVWQPCWVSVEKVAWLKCVYVIKNNKKSKFLNVSFIQKSINFSIHCQLYSGLPV